MFQCQALSSKRFQPDFDRVNLHCLTVTFGRPGSRLSSSRMNNSYECTDASPLTETRTSCLATSSTTVQTSVS